MSEFIEVHHPETGQTGSVPKAFLPYAISNGWEAKREEVVANDDRTISDVLNEVGDDPAKASDALAVEQAGKQRTTLINQLSAITSNEKE